MSRIDEIDKYYKSPEKLDNIAGFLFYTVGIMAITLPLIEDEKINSVSSTIFVVLVVLYFIVRYTNNIFFLPEAEKMRRKQLISDSFSIPLVHEITKEYYNNNISPSVIRLGANLLENSLFSIRILAKMLLFERCKVGLYFVLWVAVLASQQVNPDVIIVISQSVFSAEVIARWISMETLRVRYVKVYDDLYNMYLTKSYLTADVNPLLLDNLTNYECAKAAAGIKLSTTIFNRINDEISKEWETIKLKLKIN